jgi:hypothetical protein
MPSNLRPLRTLRPASPNDPSPTRAATGTVAVSLAAAVLVGLLLLAQNAPRGAPDAIPGANGAAEAAPRAGAQAPAALDAGVDWQRVERAPADDGQSIGAYER